MTDPWADDKLPALPPWKRSAVQCGLAAFVALVIGFVLGWSVSDWREPHPVQHPIPLPLHPEQAFPAANDQDGPVPPALEDPVPPKRAKPSQSPGPGHSIHPQQRSVSFLFPHQGELLCHTHPRAAGASP